MRFRHRLAPRGRRRDRELAALFALALASNGRRSFKIIKSDVVRADRTGMLRLALALSVAALAAGFASLFGSR
jgi:hypothetical protein